MQPMPIRYVRDVPGAQRFYEALGLRVGFAGPAPRRGGTRWVELVGAAGATMALHYVEAPDDSAAAPAGPEEEADVAAARGAPTLALAFHAHEPLEEVVARLRAVGYAPTTEIVDETFGRSFTVSDPEGLTIQVNEPDRPTDA